MTILLRELETKERSQWDKFIYNHPQGCFMQSTHWATFKKKEGYQIYYYGLFDQNQLVGGCILNYYKNQDHANLLMLTGGPIFLENYLEVGLQLLIETVEAFAKELGIIALRIEPHCMDKKKFNLAGFKRAPMDLLPSETLLIDLRPSEWQQLAQMKQKGRYNLRLSWRQGVETEFSCNDQAIPIFYDLFWETVQRKQFFGEPYGFFINLCQTLFPTGLAEIGWARWQNQILAAILVVYWGKRATYLYGGRNFEHPEIRANYAIHWAAMQRAKQRGCTVYDFYGFTCDSNHPYANFSQFKRQFGGQVITSMGAQDYFFYDSLSDTLISLFIQSRGD